ncbi:uncharacterized protein LOC107981478 [Nasonia vitripennis]|uniref:Uncharacterized protein n=1 Tax=Nasonia vitripennis TaxID=7425 RepID=A0A7M7Q9F0_NASVI|nr:uncharacterized protein LOC107981478 [Nasonia vitripennis]XP_031783874.1 uncharacterized protein LOC107981478 [Nasonia vitripennis]XP_031783875.1 uncharacterized protein LOC107981478 [Nasonia vitripennis]
MSVQGTSLNAPEVHSILKYACVGFDNDASNLYIKDIQCIIEKTPGPAGKVTFRKFLPKHEDDFDKKNCYHVKWQCQKPYSRDAVSKKIEAGRIKFPKMDWASESTYVTPERNTFSLESNEQDVSNANNKPGIFSNGIIRDESQSNGENEDDDYTKNNSLSDKNKSIKEKIVEDYKLKKFLSTRSLFAENKRDKLQVAITANGDSNGDDDETLASHEPSNLLDEEEEANKDNQGTMTENSTNAQSNKPNIQKRKPKKYKIAVAEKFELNIEHKRYEELHEDDLFRIRCLSRQRNMERNE